MKFLLLFITFIAIIFNSIAQTQDKRIPGELLVMLKDDYNPIRNAQLKADLESKGVTIEQKAGKSFNIWLFRFNELMVDANQVLKAIRQHPAVAIAQFNHPVSEREIIPNDPSFSTQWAFKNTGQSGGTPEADIHATQAWELTTNGVTALGDSIVVAVIDGGVDLNHDDLNLVKNYNEIQLNGIDDDNNGYIDDFHGWNAYNQTGNLINHDHGTHVSGIVAAKTNNGVGVAGISYNAKVLPVAGSSSTELTVVSAYDYVFTMRKLYNQTNGALGHYIVASNSSFGVDEGDPIDYPLWGAMYDSMGAQGIVNIGSTANRSWDVDIKGDIPTAMTNESLISVTNTTNIDLLNSQAAWGLNSIDLSAPGTNIYSTKAGNIYGSKTGTSMSSPMVSGSIALMHAVMDSARLLYYKSFPSLLVSRLKRYIIATVDTIPTLVGKTVSGGRLNTLEAVMMASNPPLTFADPAQLSITLKPNTSDTLTVLLSTNSTEVNPFDIDIHDTSWLSVNNQHGILEQGGTFPLQLFISTADLPVGTFESFILINDYFINQLIIPITLKVDTSTFTRNIPYNASVKINPNPFDELLKISINLMRNSQIKVIVLNLQGATVATLYDGVMQAGENLINWNGKTNNNQNVGPGVYFIAITDPFGKVTMKAIKIDSRTN